MPVKQTADFLLLAHEMGFPVKEYVWLNQLTLMTVKVCDVAKAVPPSAALIPTYALHSHTDRSRARFACVLKISLAAVSVGNIPVSHVMSGVAWDSEINR
jgi:hypothetical protein